MADEQPPAVRRLDVPDLAPGETATVPLPVDLVRGAQSGIRRLLTVSVTQPQATAWSPAGHEIAWVQVESPRVTESRADAGSMSPLPPPSSQPRLAPVTVGAGRFDSHGRLTGIGELTVDDFGLCFWRAPTDNDLGSLWEQEGDDERSQAQLWSEARLDRLEARRTGLTATGSELVVGMRYGAIGTDRGIDSTLRWRVAGPAALALSLEVAPFGDWDVPWPRIGLSFRLPAEFDAARWFGLGPAPAYPDTGQGARLGWHAMRVDDLQVPNVRPQENGSRGGLRRLLLSGPGATLRIDGDDLAFSARPWSDAALGAADHLEQLRSDGSTHVHLDFARHGIGTAACGPGVLPRYRLQPSRYAFTATFRID